MFQLKLKQLLYRIEYKLNYIIILFAEQINEHL